MNDLKENVEKLSSETGRRISAGAIREFRSRGYRGTSIQDIADASAISKPGLYYYFSSKEKLYKALAALCFEEFLLVLGAAMKKGATGYQKSLNVINACYEFRKISEEKYGFLRTLTLDANSDSPDVQLMAFWKRIISLLQKNIIDFGINRKELDETKSDCARFILQSWLMVNLRHNSIDAFGFSQRTVENSLKLVFA